MQKDLQQGLLSEKQGKDTISLMVAEETEEQRVERSRQKQDEKDSLSETDSPFTEAGSSICRINFATIDKETIGRSFKDLIEDTRHITRQKLSKELITQRSTQRNVDTIYTFIENKNRKEKFQHKKEAQQEVGFEFKGCVNPVERVKVGLLVNLAIILRFGYAYFRML